MAMSRSFGGSVLTTRSPMAISPRGDVLEPGDHAQQRGLAAAGRADEHHELTVGDVDADAVQNLDRTERLAHVADIDGRHSSPRFFLLLRAWSACGPVTLPTLRPERACNGHAAAPSWPATACRPSHYERTGIDSKRATPPPAPLAGKAQAAGVFAARAHGPAAPSVAGHRQRTLRQPAQARP